MRSKITLFLLALVALLSTMATPSYAETRLWGFEVQPAAGIWAERGLSETGIEGYRLAYDEQAVGYPLVPRGLPDSANFAQKTFGNNFSPEGQKVLSRIAGRPISSVEDLASAIRSGSVDPGDIPVSVIVRDGKTLILNTRSVQALEQAGIPRSSFNVIDKTGDPFFEGLLSDQLRRNKLSSEGVATVRPSGGS